MSAVKDYEFNLYRRTDGRVDRRKTRKRKQEEQHTKNVLKLLSDSKQAVCNIIEGKGNDQRNQSIIH